MASDEQRAVKASTGASRPNRALRAAEVGGDEASSSADAPKARSRPRGAAGEAQEHALGQELADEPPAAGPQRGADRDLARARRGAGEQQVGDVGAGDEQHEADRAQQEEESRADVAHQLSASEVVTSSISALAGRRGEGPAAPAPRRVPGRLPMRI